ncbi:MAG: sodium ion-translocating decarboxylase subunit beta [Clostridiales Family XIII bacterium]|jgi:oxaloacetate decarboxylase beta subunit|nr:sodium ion-translocating decarboxylase subunit beta [Clostridiales Family XIII bacterium]
MFLDSFAKIFDSSGFAHMTWQSLVMLIVASVLIYLAIKKQYEPLLLLPIAFGMLLANLPLGELIHMSFYHPAPGATGDFKIDYMQVFQEGGLFDILYLGVKLGIYPSLIFMGVGAMTDFGPLIARPSSLFMGAGAQFGISMAFLIAIGINYTPQEAASIGIIGGADGPTAIFLTNALAPHLLAPIAIAAYSYMALIPLIQPPFMKLLTTEKERVIKMEQMRPVSKLEKVCFAVIVTVIVILLLPSVAPLIGMLMLGNMFRESGVVSRLSDTAQNALINIVTIFLGVTVGATAVGEDFLAPKTLGIIALGLVAFIFSTVGGLLLGKLMCVLTKGKVNPLIGSAGVSAVPMAARVSQIMGQKYNPSNYLLMHAMGPNVAGVIGSAVAAGTLLALFGN